MSNTDRKTAYLELPSANNISPTSEGRRYLKWTGMELWWKLKESINIYILFKSSSINILNLEQDTMIC